jgi:hypothetical protein
MGILLVFSIAGCASKKFSLEEVEYDPQVVSHYEIEMTLNPLDKEELVDRFGTRNNPFLSPGLFMDRKNLRAFEVFIVNNTEKSMDEDNSIIVALQAIRLIYGVTAVQPLTRLQLEDFWESGGKSDARGRDMTKLIHTIREQVFPPTLTVESGTSYRGILVFRSKFPAWGEGEMEIPAFTSTKKIIGVFRDSFEF